MFFAKRAFAFPDLLNDALLEHFWNGRPPLSSDLKSFGKSLKALWPLLARQRGQQEERHYSGDHSFAETYAAYYLPVNLMKPALILEEMRLLGLSLDPMTRWMDLGCGPGTLLWGLSWWASNRDLNFEYLGLEQSKEFIRIAQTLSRELQSQLPALSKSSARWESYRRETGDRIFSRKLREFNPTVVSFMNSIGEMAADGTARLEWIKELTSTMAAAAHADGQPRWLILIEPGTQAASRELLEVREALRANSEVKVWLPCLDARMCGALAKSGDWCHEEAACEFPDWLNALGAEAGLRKEALLFSYLVCSVGEHPSMPNTWPKGGHRVVSQLMNEKGLTQCFLCTESGKTRARVLDSRQTPSNEGFLTTVRGQIYRHLDLDEKGNVGSFTTATAGLEDLDATVFPPLR
jgi:hypothetical protein